MHIKAYGTGPDRCLAFHGWGGDHREFAPLAAVRPSSAQLLSVDLPGYGRSPPPERWDLPAIMRQIQLEAESRDLKNLTVLGYCSGATFALQLAEDAPERVRRVVLLDPFAFVPGYFRLFLAGSPGRLAYRASFFTGAGRRLLNRVLRWRKGPDRNFMDAFARVNPETALGYLRLFRALGTLRRYPAPSQPMDLVYGEHTFAAVRRSARICGRLWPQAHLHCLPGVGHFLLSQGASRIAEWVFAR